MIEKYFISDEKGLPSQDPQSPYLSFLFQKDIFEREENFKNSIDAARSPLAQKLFGFPWLEEVLQSKNLLCIKKQDWVDFDIIAEPLQELIEEHLKAAEEEANRKPLIQNESSTKPNASSMNPSEQSEEEQIKNYLEENINPQVASHGGRIEFVRIEESKLLIKMEGGCQGCGMAQVTLKEGVEKAILDNFSFIQKVVDVTDHSQGLKPFFN